jgi:hypothetical protein
MQSDHYRGYEIAVEPNGQGWRVWAHPRHPDLPITRHQSFHVDADSTEDALAEARQKIDSLLEF